ncbi:MAG TPA: glutathione S-transferase family protein [Rubrivivax sp.]|jgi:glutathione S-transferase|nr:glutathione S-transferase family protein [Rubrivivax sp.]
MLTLHYYPGNASLAPHVLLREIGVPFELALVDRTRNAHKSAAYLKLNPNGLIPVLQDGDLVMYETAAICLHLADTHAAARLAPPLGSAERARFYQWLMWLTNTLQATLIHYFYPQQLAGDGDATTASQVQAQAERRIGTMLQQLDDQLAAHGGPWLLGADYSAVDPYAWMLGRWTRGFGTRPAREYPHLGPYLQRMLERPALQRVLADEGLAQPWV